MNLRQSPTAGRLGRAALLAGLVLAAFLFELLPWRPASPLETPPAGWLPAALGAPPAVSWAAPLFSTPAARGGQAHTWIGRAALALERPGVPALRAAASVLLVATSVLIWSCLRTLLVPWLPALIASATILGSGVFRLAPIASVSAATDACLAVGALLCLLRLGAGGDARLLWGALVCLGVAIDDHLPFVLLLPPIWWYARRTDPTGSRRRRGLAPLALAGIVAAVAHNLAATAMTFGAVPLAGEDGPAVSASGVVRTALAGAWALGLPLSPARLFDAGRSVAGAWFSSFGLLGLVLFALGLLTARPLGRARASLLAGCVGVLIGAALLRHPLDLAPVLLPAVAVACVAAGLGAAWVWERAGRTRAARCVVGLLLCLMPLQGVARPESAQAAEARRTAAPSLAALEPLLGARTVIVSDLPPVDRLLLPVLARHPGVERIPAEARLARRFVREGWSVVAFTHARERLQAEGIWFLRVPLVHARLDDYFQTLPAGSLVALGLPAAAGADLALPGIDGVSIGAPRRLLARAPAALAVIGVVGARQGAAMAAGRTGAIVRTDVDREVGSTGSRAPVALEVRSSERETAITVNGGLVLSSDSGLALAALDPTGRVLDSRSTGAGDGLRVRLAEGPLSPFRAFDAGQCVEVTAGEPRDVTRLAHLGAVGWSLENEGHARLRLVAGAAGREPVLLNRWMDRKVARKPGGGSVEVSVDAAAPWGTALFGEPLAKLEAQVVNESSAASRVRLCAAAPTSLVLFDLPGTRVTDLPLGERDDTVFGAGWSRPIRSAAGPLRQIHGEAIARVAVTAPSAVRVAVTPGEDSPGGSLALLVNGQAVGVSEQSRDRGHEWNVPGAVWRRGVNEVKLRAVPSPGIAKAGTPARAIRRVRFEQIGSD